MQTPKLEAVFESNPNKDFLRADYDKALVVAWSRELGRKLKYLGLPAWKMLDIIEWQEFLTRFTTIEREESQQHLLFLRANVKNVEERLHALYGEFDKILLDGRDRYGKMPDWPYELVNLDYFGGFIYPTMSRPKAVQQLIRNQDTYEQSFVLIITQQLRDGDVEKEKLGFLNDLGKSLKSGILDRGMHPAIDGIISWYQSADMPDCARQGLYVNFFLRDCGEAEHFDVRCRPPVIYPGTGRSWMIHFVTDFRYQSGVGHRVASEQSLIEVINLGLLQVQDGRFAAAQFKQPKLAMPKY